MSKLYSPSTTWFYDSEINKNIPSDAVAISDAEHEALLSGESDGMDIKWDASTNKPVVIRRVITLSEAKVAKQRDINRAADEALESITSKYPKSEISSWTIQISEAEAWIADPNADTPFIDAILYRRPSKEKAALVSSILGNATGYKLISADMIGQRQALEDKTDVATTVEGVEAIVISIKGTV